MRIARRTAPRLRLLLGLTLVVVAFAAWLTARVMADDRADALCRQPPTQYSVQVLHAVPAGSQDPDARDEILNAVGDADHYLAASGPGHRLRWACSDREIDVAPVTSPPVGEDGVVTFAEVVSAVRDQGHRRSDRIYAIYYRKGQGYDEVGEATGSGDRSHGPQYALMSSWSGFWTLHELGHALGAVPAEAPHQTLKGHCFELNDVMCRRPDDVDDAAYDDIVVVNCPEAPAWLFDCNNDDYYLHDNDWWDVADSPYLYLAPPEHRPKQVRAAPGSATS